MKIYIEHITQWRNILLLLAAILLVIFGFFSLIPGLDAIWSQRILGLGLVLAAWCHIRMVYRKYYIGYNGQAMLIRMGKFPGRWIRFEHVREFQIENGLMHIELNDGEHLTIDLDGTDSEKREELNEFILRRLSRKKNKGKMIAELNNGD